MYTGKNKTALTSQRMIAEALMDLLEHKPFSQISISELCLDAQVSRQTFYSLFKSKKNVLLYVFENNYKFMVDDYSNIARFSLDDFSKGYTSYLIKNQYFLKMLINNGLSSLIYKAIYTPVLECNKMMPVNFEYEKEYFASFVAGSLTSITETIFLKEEKLDYSKIYTMVSSLLGGGCFLK